MATISLLTRHLVEYLSWNLVFKNKVKIPVKAYFLKAVSPGLFLEKQDFQTCKYSIYIGLLGIFRHSRNITALVMCHASLLLFPEKTHEREWIQNKQKIWKNKTLSRKKGSTPVQSKRCQKAGQTYSEAVVVAETVGRGIVQTQMGCGQGRRRKRREVGRLAQIRRRRRELLRGGAQTEWNSVWHSTGHLQTWRQRMGRHYSLYYGLRLPKKGGGWGSVRVYFSSVIQSSPTTPRMCEMGGAARVSEGISPIQISVKIMQEEWRGWGALPKPGWGIQKEGNKWK